MIKIIRIILIITLHFILLTKVFSQDCGTERWSIKTLSDSDTSLINFNSIIKSSVHEQINYKRPIGKFNKRQASETTVYSIDCYIIGYKKEKDKDVHIIIKDIKTEELMVIEIASSQCSSIQQTSRYGQIKLLNEWFAKNIGTPHSSFKMLNTPILVNITGIGFWDFIHGQKGMASNGREIHPVLSMKLKQ